MDKLHILLYLRCVCKVVIKYDQPTQSVQLINALAGSVNSLVYVPTSFQQLPYDFEMSFIDGRENVRSFIWEVQIQIQIY